MHERLLAADVAALVRTKGYDIVCIADLPPSPPTKSRYLVKKMRAQLPDLRVTVGRWAHPDLADDTAQPLLDAGASHVATSLLDTRKYLAAASENCKAAATSDDHFRRRLTSSCASEADDFVLLTPAAACRSNSHACARDPASFIDSDPVTRMPEQAPTLFIRQLADQAFSRASGAPLREGNRVGLLKDAAENYPAWLTAIRRGAAHDPLRDVHHPRGRAGQAVRRCAARARPREGVTVRLLYDWMGGFGKTSRGFWNRLRAGGVEVRCYNPPRFDQPARLGQPRSPQDDRRSTARSPSSPACASARRGSAIRSASIDPWRDTGVEVRGPAVADIEEAFAEAWAAAGPTAARRAAAVDRRIAAAPAMSPLRVVADRAEHRRAVPRRSARRGDGARTRCG